MLGHWVSTGGKSKIDISQIGKSNNMKVSTKLVLGKDNWDKTLNSVAFGKTWQGELGKDKFGAKVYLKATFSEKGDKMEVKIWRDGLIDTTVAEGSFVKK